MPDIPDDIDDVILEREWKRTWNGKKFLSYQDNNWGILVFATKKNYQRLERCDVIYADGTFKTCPPPYTQFVTIHGLFQERVLPFVMCLLTGKTFLCNAFSISHTSLSGEKLRPVNLLACALTCWSSCLYWPTVLPVRRHITKGRTRS
jgi:hypothetical protein